MDNSNYFISFRNRHVDFRKINYRISFNATVNVVLYIANISDKNLHKSHNKAKKTAQRKYKLIKKKDPNSRVNSNLWTCLKLARSALVSTTKKWLLISLTWNTCTSTIWWTQPWTFYWRWCRWPDWWWRRRIRATGTRWPRVPGPSTRGTRRKICSVERTGPSKARTWRKPGPTPCWLSAPLQRRSRPTISSSFYRGETWGEHGT